MPNKKTVVRVVIAEDDKLARCDASIRFWLEQFRYAGLMQVNRDDETGMCFDVRAPHGAGRGASAERWAKANAERMRSFGINAVCAPPWPHE